MELDQKSGVRSRRRLCVAVRPNVDRCGNACGRLAPTRAYGSATVRVTNAVGFSLSVLCAPGKKAVAPVTARSTDGHHGRRASPAPTVSRAPRKRETAAEPTCETAGVHGRAGPGASCRGAACTGEAGRRGLQPGTGAVRVGNCTSNTGGF